MIKNIFFDLDGTLNDSSIGIIKAVKYALKNFDIEIEDQAFLRRYIGPPLVDCFMEFNNLEREKAEKALFFYREYYNTVGKFENAVYDGIKKMLKGLKESGIRLFVATSKPEDVMNDIVSHFGLREYFDGVYGASLDSKRNKKTMVIKYALENSKVNPTESVMVGDHKHDVNGAKDNGLKSVAVTYGYGDLEELKNSRPDYMVDTVKELRELLFSLI